MFARLILMLFLRIPTEKGVVGRQQAKICYVLVYKHTYMNTNNYKKT